MFEVRINRLRRINLKAIFGIPLFWVIIASSLLIYLAPLWGSINHIHKTKKAVLSDNELSVEEARKYLSELENDKYVLGYLAGDEDLNVALMKLYVCTEDYASIISLSQAALQKKETQAYDPYLKIAYASRHKAYRSYYDAGLAAFYGRRFDEAVEKLNYFLRERAESSPLGKDPDIYKAENDECRIQAESALQAISLVRPFDEAVMWGNLGDAETAQISARMEENPQLLKFVLHNQEYNIAIFELYLNGKDYAKIFDRAAQAVNTRDYASYHFYLGVAYEKTDKLAAAVKEMKLFLEQDPESIKGDRFAVQREYANMFLSRHYQTQNNYAESNKLLQSVIRDRLKLAQGDRALLLQEAVSVVIDKKEYKGAISDSDRDGLSDGLEDVLALDKENPDADKDKIRDRNELLQGRNPRKKAPDDLYSDKEYYEIYMRIVGL